MGEKYVNENNEVGVLISYGFGAGWSTWNDFDWAIDKRIIEKFVELTDKKEDITYEQAKKEMGDYMESIGYNGYLGGFDGLTLEFIQQGTPIKINEYDGTESLEIGYSEFTQL